MFAKAAAAAAATAAAAAAAAATTAAAGYDGLLTFPTKVSACDSYGDSDNVHLSDPLSQRFGALEDHHRLVFVGDSHELKLAEEKEEIHF